MKRNPSVLQARNRNKRIAFERRFGGTDGYGHKTIKAEVREVARAWAGIGFGSGGEQREAAQQGGSQTATFFVVGNDVLQTIGVRDRIRYPLSDPDPAKWPAWEISAIEEIGFNEGFGFTATRVAS